MRHSYCLLLNLSAIGGLVAAFATPLTAFLIVPEFAAIAARVGLICGIIISPLAYWCLRETDLWKTVPAVMLWYAAGFVGLVILAAITGFPNYGYEILPSLLIVVAVILLLVRRSAKRIGQTADIKTPAQYCRFLAAGMIASLVSCVAVAMSAGGSLSLHFLTELGQPQETVTWITSLEWSRGYERQSLTFLLTWVVTGGFLLAPIMHWSTGPGRIRLKATVMAALAAVVILLVNFIHAGAGLYGAVGCWVIAPMVARRLKPKTA